jgi:hypothetical protein
MFEKARTPLATRKKFLNRVLRNLLWSSYIVVFSLLIGTLGYHFIAELGWVDSFYNSSMILTGMGPTNAITCVSGKIFASFYALFSGLAFLTTMAVFLAPLAHRFMHKFHLEDEE